jgi:hypothetical protein
MAPPSALFVPELEDVEDSEVAEDPEVPEDPDEPDDPVAVAVGATGSAALWA